MLIHISKRNQRVAPIVGDAHIVLTIQSNGELLLSAYRLGEWNSTYANAGNTVVDEIPGLLAELRAELAEATASPTQAAAETAAQGV